MSWVHRFWQAISDAMFAVSSGKTTDPDSLRRAAEAVAPVVWLLGKAGAGKTSIVSALTGDPRAEVGAGFAPCTKTAAFYDVPPDTPLLRFLDTRGLGEPGYNPNEDIAWCEDKSHLLLVVMQVSDPDQQAIIDVLLEVRRRHKEWPVVVAQSGLHRRYSADVRQHHTPYSFTGDAGDLHRDDVPHVLRQALNYQRLQFAGLPGPPPLFVPLDFTLPEDGFEPAEYGLEALWQSLELAGPAAFGALHRARAATESDAIRARARPLIYAHATAAAGAGAVPVPLVGAGGLAGTLALMLRALARRYNVAWTPGTFAQFGGAVGGGTLLWWGLRYGFQEVLKLIPGIGTWAGGALNAMGAFALSVGVGEAACVWLAYQNRGLVAPNKEVRHAFATGLAEGLRHARHRQR